MSTIESNVIRVTFNKKDGIYTGVYFAHADDAQIEISVSVPGNSDSSFENVCEEIEKAAKLFAKRISQ